MKKAWGLDVSFILITVACALWRKGDSLIACLMTISCVILARLTFLFFPKIITKKQYALILLFIATALVLGKMLNGYGMFPHLDFFLHLVSGVLLADIGKTLFQHTAVTKAQAFWLPFLFGSTLAGLWEVYEFLGDTLFGLQAQGGSLTDTMTDIIAGNISCLVTTFLQQKKRL